MSLFSFFKKQEPFDFKSAKNIAIVYNLVYDCSLLAACLYYMALTLTGRSVVLIDIRDNLPLEADAYIWIGVGDADVIRSYVQAESVESDYLRSWAVTFHKRSVFIDSDFNDDLSFDKSLIGVAMMHFWNTFFEVDSCYVKDIGPNNPTFRRYAVLSEKWLTNSMAKDEVAIYLNAILYCYAGSVGSQALEIEELESNLSMNEAEVERIMGVYGTMNKVMSQSCRERVIDKVRVLYVTKMGPEVFPLIRRIALANRQFYHSSEGSYGKIVFKSKPV